MSPRHSLYGSIEMSEGLYSRSEGIGCIRLRMGYNA
jgi:hypothetical protein